MNTVSTPTSGAFGRQRKEHGVTRLRIKYCLTTLLVLLCGTLNAATINLTTKLAPNAGEAASFDRMGQAVAVSGNTAVVGAYLATQSGSADAGTAYVFLRNGAASWTRQQKIAHPNPAVNDLFGNAVAISGDTIAIAAILDDEASANNAGAVYIFTRSGGVWTLQQRIIANDPTADAGFGRSVAIEGNTLVVGAHRANAGTGAAYVFTRSGSVWSQQQRLIGNVRAVGDYFGGAVALSGDRLVVGAERADNGLVIDAGAAYAFLRSGGQWSEQARLTPATFSQDDNFGISVAISGATIAVGQPFLGGGASDNKGAVIVFSEAAGTWTRTATVLASDASANDFFGRSVSLSSDMLVVGAYFDDFDRSATTIVNGGSAYLYRRNGNNWNELDKLQGGDTVLNDLMGSAVAISGAAMIIGAPLDSAASLTEAGTAFVNARDDVTVTDVSVNNAAPAFGETITITAVVTPSDFDVGTPEGFVQFFSGGLSMGSVQLGASNTATLNFTPTVSGNHHITARYNGDSNHLESTSPIRTVAVARVVTSVTLTPPAANSVPYGTNLTYTANLSVVGSSPLPTGTIRFIDGATNLGAVNLVNGVATLNISTLATGVHNISAAYLGDANYQPFTTPSDAIEVTQAVVSMALTTTESSTSLEGNPVSVVATLSGGLPTGLPVTFVISSPSLVILGTTNTNASGIASINTAALPAGIYQFTATSTGDINHTGATDISGLHSVLAAANLTITKTNNQTYVESGSTTTYTIVATNNGPNPVAGASIIDDIDDDLVTGLFEQNAPWSCVAAGGASCTGGPSGLGDINLAVDIPVGGTITIQVQAQSRPDAEPFVSNTASIVLPSSMGDPDQSNNQSTDSDPSGVFGNGFEVPKP
jgi:uncharacterized repeat protein (TIGR01451 family)